MSIICPTVLAQTADDYHEQLQAVTAFANRIQIDLGDGEFTSQTIGIGDISWPATAAADIHLMYRDPLAVLPKLAELHPSLVIIHAEAATAREAIQFLNDHNIRAGVALLQPTNVKDVSALIRLCNHVLIFSGSLGSFGGRVDFSLLKKAQQIRSITPDIEIGWDGGVNVDNVRKLADGGIDVLNVGGAIQKANHPENAYRDLVRRLYD